MCGGFVGDVLDTVTDAVEDVGDFIGDTVQAIADDPLQTIVTVGAMAMGVPPIWAGALGGAAGAAEHGGNILEGAALGGAAGWAGGAAAGAAGGAGAGQILSSAAGGAAAGATVGALTGGDIIKSALTGAAGGAVTGTAASYFMGPSGSTTYTYDDGSTITYSADGQHISSTAATDGSLAPVYEYNPETYQVELVQQGTGSIQGSNMLPVSTDASGMLQVPSDLVSTGISDSAAGTIYNGPNGPEIVLESGKTVLLSDYQEAIASGKPVSIDGNMSTDFKVESSGIPRSVENPGTGSIPDGYELASIENSNGARWDDALDTYVNSNTGAYYDSSSNAWVQPTGTGTYTPSDFDIPSSYVAPVTVNADGSTATQNYNGSVTTTFPNGTTLTSNPDGTYTSRDSTGKISTGESGGENSGGIKTGAGTTYVYDDGSTITIHSDGTSTSTPAPGSMSDAGEITVTADRPTANTNLPPVTDLTGTPVGPNAPTVGTPYTPVFPITGTTPRPPQGVDAGYTPPQIGNLTRPITDIGLSPGFIKPTPFYNTTSDVQDPYYWGAHGFQTGDTFDAGAYNQVPYAPQQSWGLQQPYQQLTPAQVAELVQAPGYQSQFSGAVPGPVAPGSV
jgi:hypothetical protein